MKTQYLEQQNLFCVQLKNGETTHVLPAECLPPDWEERPTGAIVIAVQNYAEKFSSPGMLHIIRVIRSNENFDSLEQSYRWAVKIAGESELGFLRVHHHYFDTWRQLHSRLTAPQQKNTPYIGVKLP